MTTRDQKRRLCIVGGVFGLAVLVLWVRLFQVQYIRHDEYLRIAEKQRVAPRVVAADRGGIAGEGFSALLPKGQLAVMQG